MRIVMMIVTCSIIGICATGAVTAQKKEVISSLCQFSLPDELKQSNTNFTDGFTFKIDSAGTPFEIRRVVGKYIDVKDVESCLGRWKLLGFQENSRVSVYFSWKHGIGWSQMRILAKDFSEVVIKGNNSCPD